MIIGVGTDILERDRIFKALSKESFVKKCYTDKEIETLSDSPLELAGNFCVKECVAKALGTGFVGFAFIDIEVLRDERGKPYVNLYNGAKERADELGVTNIQVSISDLKDLVNAIAIAEA